MPGPVVNVMEVGAAAECWTPSYVTYHVGVPKIPDSVKVVVQVVEGEKAMFWVEPAARLPDDGEGV